ncbi:glycosyltransferase family 4 protein [uncultured Thiohalocapsa sp.]|uniref:glycosyltransferase family 4 protein n=1 Tax=uncultured Thiohalocapsa sp. TaxID=768990 RepID=UPI0025E8B5BC|nr:glycosyltransferase family 4 protein [uncultured Thiohalocapsa sp.]
MHKDLLSDRFGRYYELPLRLSRSGFDVDMVLFSYRWRHAERVRINDHFTIRSYGILGAGAMLLHLLAQARSDKIQIILGSSDMPYCILAVLLAKLVGRRCACDIYDNFETYTSARIPLLLPLFYQALHKTDVIVTFEQTLSDYLQDAHRVGAICTVPNGVDPTVFRPLDKLDCRRALGLPADVPIVGYFGSLTKQRGSQTLFQAFDRIRKAVPDTVFLLAGGVEPEIQLPAHNLKHLGLLPQQALPQAICASDVCCIHYSNNDFARFSFPQKMMEYIACGVPFVAPQIGGAGRFLADFPYLLYRVDDAQHMALQTLALLRNPDRPLPPPWTWAQAAESFNAVLSQVPMEPTT